jgi:prephenate dehydrogenase
MKFEIIKSNKKIELFDKLITQLDDLYEDLTYENNEKELESINRKIKIREDIIKSLNI